MTSPDDWSDWAEHGKPVEIPRDPREGRDSPTSSRSSRTRQKRDGCLLAGMLGALVVVICLALVALAFSSLMSSCKIGY